MQKTSLKASILIWATFLSLIITVTFISISTKINKNLKNNSNLTEQLGINNQIQNIISSGSIDGNFTNQYLDNGDKIIFNSSNSHITSINKGEFHLSQININSSITIDIQEGGPVKYKNNTEEGLVNDLSSFSVTPGNLLIENLGGYAKIKISSTSNQNFLSKYRYYEIIRKIGNKEIVKAKGTIKNF